MNLIDPIVRFHDDIRAIRRDIHAHPELKFEEHRTADLIAARLEEWGIPVTRGLGGTGVVGSIEGTRPSAPGARRPSIGLRADMDALPVQEVNAFPHRSRHEGRMHACGHDGHVAMLLAAARHLASQRDFAGTVQLIFQPAEEGGGGARRMMEDGLFERFPCDAVFGMHNWPGMKAGQFGVKAGPLMASSNEFDIIVRGKGGHAAMPHLTTDPVIVATHLVQAFQTIVSRNIKPVDPAVLSVTQINAGDTTNIIPNSARMAGTVRTFTLDVLDRIEEGMRHLCDTLPGAFGATAEFHFHRNYPPTINHAAETAFAASVLADVVGQENVLRDIEPTMGAEDFSYFLLEKPGCYLFIGNGDGAHRCDGHGLGPCMLHNPSYDFNDDLIPIGASFYVRLVERFMASR